MQASEFFHHALNDCDAFFSREFNLARQRFLDAGSDLTLSHTNKSWQLEDDLHCDTLWVGSHAAENVLVLISGTHGVEGYCGSGVQNFILQSIKQDLISLPCNTALLFIHALNPWGMKHYRRCDQDGIDLNRNFVDFSMPLPVNSGYSNYLEKLAGIQSNQRFHAIEQFAKELGQQSFDEIFSGGQYHCDWGPFYGGQQASWSNRVIEEIVNHYQLNEKCLIVLDIHSGLGPWGFGELISDHPLGSNGANFAHQLFENAVAQTLMGGSFSVSKHGLLDYRWQQMMQTHGCFLTLEFGSFGTAALFQVLLDDHLLHREKTGLSEAEIHQQAQQMLRHFCPKNSFWEQAVLFKSWQVVEQTLKKLSGSNHVIA